MSADKGFAIIEALLMIIAIPIILAVMTFFVTAFGSGQAQMRCEARGFKTSETIVHYPDFWHVDNYCYNGSQAKGVKL